jgi:PHD/YefM family antitoxin component YafN of YafNO toxin-antitoxin module
MIMPGDICSLTEFQRNVKEHMKRLKKTGRPEVLTVNGSARLVVQDAEAYQRLLDALDRLETIEGIRRGLEDVEAGRVVPIEKAFAGIRRMLGIPRNRKR